MPWWGIVLAFILFLFSSLRTCPPAGVAFLWVHVSSDSWWPDGIITQFQLQCAGEHIALLKPWPPLSRPISWRHTEKAQGDHVVIYFNRTWTVQAECVYQLKDLTITLIDRWHNFIVDRLVPSHYVDDCDLVLSVCARERVCECLCAEWALHLGIREWWAVESIRNVISGAVHLSIWMSEILRG